MSLNLSLEPGFADPVLGAQSAFRALLDAMARPGSVVPVAPLSAAPGRLSPVAAALALTLLDHETPLWLDPALADSQALRAWIGFHSGAPLVERPGDAAFALLADPKDLPSLEDFALGSETYPDRSASLILQAEAFHDAGPRLSGPGLAVPRRFGVSPLPEDFWFQRRDLQRLFPRGIDVIWAAPAGVAALPRSTKVELD